jgi:cyclohexanone monooxygenase
MLGANSECTPGYYNNEGQPLEGNGSLFVGYPQGAMAYFAYIADWRTNGRFDGLAFR